MLTTGKAIRHAQVSKVKFKKFMACVRKFSHMTKTLSIIRLSAGPRNSLQRVEVVENCERRDSP